MRIRVCVATVLLTVASSAFAEASIDDVYKAASAGHLAEAQSMMAEVLKAHPDSAKAHFVEAELLARQHNIDGARAELARATAINPSLSFTKPESVLALKRSLGEVSGVSGGPIVVREPIRVSRGTPTWVWPAGFALLILLVVWMVRNNRSRSGYVGGPSNMMGPGSPAPYSPYGPQYGPQYGAPPAGGSGLLGSLATGAAIGGGIVAGEALAHRLLDSDEPHRYREDDTGPGYVDNTPPPDSSMGGEDFGIGDSSGGWDDDNSGGGSW